MFLNYANAPLIFTAVLLISILSVIFYFKRSYQSRNKITDDFLEQINLASRQEIYSIKKNEDKLPGKWNSYWGNSFKKAGWVKPEVDNKKIGNLVILVTLGTYGVVTLLTQNIGIGLVPVISGHLFLYLFMEKAIDDRQEVFDEQVPAFLSLLKSNLRAGETPEKALANAIDETDEPLYGELKNARALIDLGSFQYALNQMRESTTSEALRFLCGCIELSSKVGANLEKQVSIIEEMLESNRSLKRKLKVAISKNTPLLILSSILIPGIFIFQYLFNEQARNFWFIEPMSWIAFILTISIYLGGIFLSKKIIKSTGKFD